MLMLTDLYYPIYIAQKDLLFEDLEESEQNEEYFDWLLYMNENYSCDD